MSQPAKVLVAVASRHGATLEIADAIGTMLAAEGVEPLVVPVAEAPDPRGFEAVVLGSAVYMGRWLGEATAFATEHVAALAERPTWLFSSGPIGDPPKPEAPDAVDVGELVEAIGPRDHALFAGKLDKGKLGFGERAVVLAFRAPEGDYRDWGAIEAWAREIARQLRP